MQLTPEQLQTVKNGQPLRFTAENTEFVVLRADTFERVERLLYDDSPLSDQERQFLLREAGRRAGWDDPELDVYEQYREPK